MKDFALAANFKRYFKDQIWKNLLSHQKFKKKSINGISDKSNSTETIFATKKYIETEIMEYTICAFILKFPKMILNEEVRGFFTNIYFENNKFNDLKNLLLDKIISDEFFINGSIEQIIKNAGLSELFMVLSNPSGGFLNFAFTAKNDSNNEMIFNWIRKQYYLSLLKKEHDDITKNNSKNNYSQISSYIEEIQKISKELDEIQNSFLR